MERALYPRDHPLRIAHRATQRPHPHTLAAGGDDLQFPIKRDAGTDYLANHVPDARQMLRRVELNTLLQGRLGAARHLMDVAGHIRPEHAHLRQLDRPAAKMRQLARHQVQCLAFTQFGFGLLEGFEVGLQIGPAVLHRLEQLRVLHRHCGQIGQRAAQLHLALAQADRLFRTGHNQYTQYFVICQQGQVENSAQAEQTGHLGFSFGQRCAGGIRQQQGLARLQSAPDVRMVGQRNQTQMLRKVRWQRRRGRAQRQMPGILQQVQGGGF